MQYSLVDPAKNAEPKVLNPLNSSGDGLGISGFLNYGIRLGALWNVKYFDTDIMRLGLKYDFGLANLTPDIKGGTFLHSLQFQYCLYLRGYSYSRPYKNILLK